jgi:hypothetical protein
LEGKVAEFGIFEADVAEAEADPVLGPAYFAARRASENFMAAFEAEHFKPLIDKFAGDLQDKLWSDLENFLLSDTESNLHTSMWRMVDDVVRAICGGEQWGLQRYALGDRHDCAKVRETLCRLIPAELQDARVADLEAQLAKVSADLTQARTYRERF